MASTFNQTILSSVLSTHDCVWLRSEKCKEENLFPHQSKQSQKFIGL